MARNPEIEGILKAWWELDHCQPTEKARRKGTLDGLLAQVVARGRGAVTPDQIQTYLYPQYKDYCRELRKAGRISVQQSAMKP
jgi:hypothetical protein